MRVAYRFQTNWETKRNLLDWGTWPKDGGELNWTSRHLRWNAHPLYQPAFNWARDVFESGRNAVNDRAAFGVLSACRIVGGAGLNNEDLDGIVSMSGNGNLFMILASRISTDDLYTVYLLIDASRGYVRDHILPLLTESGVDVSELSNIQPLLYETEAPWDMAPLETKAEYVIRNNRTEEVWREEVEPFAVPAYNPEIGKWSVTTPYVWMNQVAAAFAAENPEYFNAWAENKFAFQESMNDFHCNRDIK